MSSSKLADAFARVEARLGRFERDYDRFTSTRGQAKLDAFEDLVIHGRALTNVIQNCRHALPAFEKWYDEKIERLKSDAAIQRFYKMRSEILKEGRLGVRNAAVMFSMEPWFPPPPEHAVAFVPWDEETGRCAWIVKREDGSEEKILSDRTADVKIDEFLSFSPTIDGVDDVRVDEVVHRYVRFLRRMVDELRRLMLTAG